VAVVLRKDERGVIAIGQPSHAWLSGQLARAWGNPRFGAVDPFEEVCLAAEQHDIGMAAWDLAAPLNPDTGLPQSFLEMALPTHMLLWRLGPRRVLPQSRYAALLVSMHGARLYEQRDLQKLPSDHAEAVRAFLGEQREFQDRLRRSLRDDPVTAAAATPRTVARNSDLVWIWDLLSLALCLDWVPQSVANVPTVDGAADLELTATDGGALRLDPWPFAADTVTVGCEGKRLTDRVQTDQLLQEALAAAPWETVRFELRRA
jgi:Protein of unknown function (DUF3891)